MDYETAQDVFRQAVLEAMDSAARDIFRDVKAAARNDVGAQDRDLPKIFPTIDAQLDRMIARDKEAKRLALEWKPDGEDGEE